MRPPIEAAAEALEVEDCEIPLPTGKCITPTAAPGSEFRALDPDLADFPDYRSGQAISTAVSPDRKTLLILVSGFNAVNGPDGNFVPEASTEYVFVYDIGGSHARNPVKRQVLKIPNTFAGLAFAPDGKAFYVSGGGDDTVHTFTLQGSQWGESGDPISLGHTLPDGTKCGLGYRPCAPGQGNPLAAGGVAVTPDGKHVVVANLYNNSLTVVDVKQRRKVGEIELRPGLVNPNQTGVPGGEYPFWLVIKGNDTAYVSSIRDREIVVVSLKGAGKVLERIKVAGNPNKMILNRDQSLLFVAEDNSDLVSVVDTKKNKIVASVRTTAPQGLLDRPLRRYTGSNPNSLALSPDEQTLYVTNGQTSSVAVIRWVGEKQALRVEGLIPTGWYPNAVSVSADGRWLYVVNGKSPAGPNPKLTDPSANQYVLQLEKAGFLILPVPGKNALNHLTRIVAANNGLKTRPVPEDEQLFAALRQKIKHVIYAIRENRTYDQILGDLPQGNGDPSLTMFPQAITPNLHRLASDFVLLDNFYVSGEVSGNGWPWSTAGRESDFGTKAMPIHYSGRGMSYEYEGINRDINVGLATLAERKQSNPNTPDDPNLLPGAINVVEPDGPKGAEPGEGYIWDAVLRKGLTFRNYGCFADLPLNAPLVGPAFAQGVIQSQGSNPELLTYGDPYFRGYDNCYPDYWREYEWEREFAQFEQNGQLPALSTVQLPMDHMGCFGETNGVPNNIGGLTTPELQQADGDYALGKLVQRVANSPYKDSTLIIALEDDAQDGPDHVSAHRSTIYVAGPYVKQKALVSEYYTTVNVIRTIEDLLDTEHLNLNTATARPMSELFDLKQTEWDFKAKPADVLYQSTLPLPPREEKHAALEADQGAPARLERSPDWWKERTQHLDFSRIDAVDLEAFNRIFWEGIMGDRPYPAERSGADLRQNREGLLAAAAADKPSVE